MCGMKLICRLTDKEKVSAPFLFIANCVTIGWSQALPAQVFAPAHNAKRLYCVSAKTWAGIDQTLNLQRKIKIK